MVVSAGCSAPSSALILRSQSSGQAYVQKFNQAWWAHNDDGTDEFLLIGDDSQAKPPRQAPKLGQPLVPASTLPFRHIVHVTVLWRPMYGNPAETPITSNSVIDWFIVSEGPGRTTLEYQGAGYATVWAHGSDGALSIRSARLRSTTAQPSDALGELRATGSMTARLDPQRLHDLLQSTRSGVAAAE
jgi:hypothetical protein